MLQYRLMTSKERIQEITETRPGFVCFYKLGREQMGLRIIPTGSYDKFELLGIPENRLIATANVSYDPQKNFDFLSDYPEYLHPPIAALTILLDIALNERHELDIDNPYCGRGIGTALTKAAIEYLRRREVKTVFAHTSYENYIAKRVLQKTGFTKIPESQYVWYLNL